MSKDHQQQHEIFIIDEDEMMMMMKCNKKKKKKEERTRKIEEKEGQNKERAERYLTVMLSSISIEWVGGASEKPRWRNHDMRTL